MEAEANRRAYLERKYAMKKHHATSLHYDLRLAWNGVLLSWAIPEGPSCHAGMIRKAVEMEDHRESYLAFEGVHKTGPIMLWDRGTWELDPDSEDIEGSLRRGIMQFTLHGEKLKGIWMLTKVSNTRNGRQPIWTLCKQDDSFARKAVDMCILKERPKSVLTGKSMEEIVRDWTSPKDKHERQTKLFD